MQKKGLDFNRLLEIWDSCPNLKDCEMPYASCLTCTKWKRPAPIKKEVRYAYDEYRPCDT